MCVITKTSLIETKDIGLIINPLINPLIKIIEKADPYVIYDHNGDIMRNPVHIPYMHIDLSFFNIKIPKYFISGPLKKIILCS